MQKESILSDVVILNDRREFIKKAGLLLGAGLSLPVISTFISSCSKNEGPVNPGGGPLTVKISDYPALSTIGNAVKVTSADFNGGRAVMIIKTGTAAFLTLSTKCTHMGCEVNLPSGGEIHCPCHGSIYSAADGSVIQGPAPAALPKLANTYDSGTGILTITG